METRQSFSYEIATLTIKSDPASKREQSINEAINDVLLSLGTGCRKAIYDFLEEEYDLKPRDIAGHPTEFCQVIERIFGRAGSLIEIGIIEELHRRIPQFIFHASGELSLPAYLDAMSRSNR